jgi:hypothetical protein
MTRSSGGCKASEAAVAAIWAAAAAGQGLAAPSRIRISDTLAVFQQLWAEQRGLGVSAKAKEFGKLSNLTEKSVTDQALLKAGEELLRGNPQVIFVFSPVPVGRTALQYITG